ncbi:MAG: putative manganese-dependent inorganic diphosphatase [Clostridiales bacterium]|nr:putative manganese-dependent inorganic diphosphatase [Clostridiales bacterium]
MNEIYVTGHRNPDTDSIVSAMAFAAMQNSLGKREYEAARLGHISDETQLVLDHFGFEPPPLLKTMRTQVQDLDYDTPPILNPAVTMDCAWHALSDGKINSIPVVNEDGSLYGMLSAGDIASYDMQTVYDTRVDGVPLFNLLGVLEGKILNEDNNRMDSVSGTVVIALPQSYDSLVSAGADTILICGNQPDMIQQALTAGVRCIILCQTEAQPEWLEAAGDTYLISTPFDACRTSRLLYQAVPISRVCHNQKLVCFHLDDYIDDVREVVLKSRYRCYPILDGEEKVVGTLSRFHLLRPRRKRVVLMDHNEAAQSVPGLTQAEIVGIIDHHRLADIQTSQPIYFRNEPVGSTTTIVTGMYQERGLMPSPKLAGLMAAAILADTVMFKSPTCTKRDIAMAQRLARIANLSLDELGKAIFSVSTADKSVEDLFHTDYKEFHIAEHFIGVSQITCVDSPHMMDRKAEFLALMEKKKEDNHYDMILLMLTDVLLEGTQLLFVGDEDTISQAFTVDAKDHTVFLPRVMSRKKQIIPMLSAMWG